MNNAQRDDLFEIVYQKITGQALTTAQEAALASWLADPGNAATYNKLLNKAERTQQFLDVVKSSQQMKVAIDERLKEDYQQYRRQKSLRDFWKIFPYAAVVVFLAGLLWLMLEVNHDRSGMTPGKIVQVQPGSDKATLTLGDGSTVTLGAADTGLLAHQGKSQVVQQGNGQLQYQPSLASDAVVYNTISTPRGGQYRLILPDNSKVWLNAATRLRFPSSFTGDTRTVELLDGEAYFEISPNQQQPFTVLISTPALDDDMRVTVLGTHFNIRTSGHDRHCMTTLLEGKVAVEKGNQRITLAPMQQALATAGKDELQVSTGILADTIVDWTKNLFVFKNDKLTTVMQKLSAWYDVDIEYIDDPSISAENRRTGANGTISRAASLAEVLRILQIAGIRCEVEQRTVKVYL